MAENEKRECPRDCKKCTMPQQVYCAAQIALSTMNMVQSLSEKFDAIVGQVNGIQKQVGMIAPIAQEGEAVQIIDSPVTNQKKKNNELQ